MFFLFEKGDRNMPHYQSFLLGVLIGFLTAYMYLSCVVDYLKGEITTLKCELSIAIEMLADKYKE